MGRGEGPEVKPSAPGSVSVSKAAQEYLPAPSKRAGVSGGSGLALNNPGNLKTPSGDFKRFGSLEEGWEGLHGYLKSAVTGKHARYSPDMSLKEFFGVYAPKSDKNDPDAYASSVAKSLGVTPATPIRRLAGRLSDWAQAINKIEWGTSKAEAPPPWLKYQAPSAPVVGGGF